MQEMQETQSLGWDWIPGIQSLGREDPLQKKIHGQRWLVVYILSMGSQRVGHDLGTKQLLWTTWTISFFSKLWMAHSQFPVDHKQWESSLSSATPMPKGLRGKTVLKFPVERLCRRAWSQVFDHSANHRTCNRFQKGIIGKYSVL